MPYVFKSIVGAGVVAEGRWGCLPFVLPECEALVATERRWQSALEQHRPEVGWGAKRRTTDLVRCDKYRK